MQIDQNATLNYEAMPRRRRRSSRYFLLAVVALGICVAFIYRVQIKRLLDTRYVQWQVSRAMPAEQIIIRTPDSGEIATLRGNSQYHFNRRDKDIEWYPECLNKILERTAAFPHPMMSHGMGETAIFPAALTFRKSRSGNRRIVLIGISEYNIFQWHVILPATWFENPRYLRGGTGGFQGAWIQRIATTIDPKDERHIRIDFKSNSTTSWFDVWLEDDDTISLFDAAGIKVREFPTIGVE